MSIHVFRASLLMLLLVSAVGCSQPDRLTGKVFVNEMEVTVGNMMFTPDIDAGVDGPSVLADVRDGNYSMFGDKPFTPGKNSVMLTVAQKWLTSQGQDNSDMTETDASTTLTKSFDLPAPGADSYDLRFEFDMSQLDADQSALNDE